MTDITENDDTAGFDRRSLIKRGAIVGGALVWTTPIVQSIATPAFADTSPVTQGCIGGASPKNYFIKFNAGSATPETSTGKADVCLPDMYAEAVKGLPAGTSASQFSAVFGPKAAGGQVVTVTLPAGFVVNDAEVKVGNATGQGDDADATAGCIDEDKITVSQTGQVVTITIQNTDSINPAISHVNLVYSGCVPA
jgi:hypothetical protein